jgi:3-deoxy-manno-octulosonate cytidylyltransferase (CMP-KDO synthetase)
MDKINFSIIIPARYQSSRFPGKPLAQIHGKSLVRRVWDKCCEVTGAENIYVATDDIRILNHCQEQGINGVMTNMSCLTGTDRVFEASEIIKSDFYINVQGDEPLIDSSDIQKIIESLHLITHDTIINAQCEIKTSEDYFNCNIPKVVSDCQDNLLYISRAPIPYSKSEKFISAKKAVGIYGYNKNQLQTFYNQKNKTPLELIEDIEILRFLELGYKIKMIPVSTASVSVDTISDLQLVQTILTQQP